MRTIALGLLLLCLGENISLAKTYYVTEENPSRPLIKRNYRKKADQNQKSNGFVQLNDGPGFVVANPQRSWGTPFAIYNLNRVLALYHQTFPKAQPVIVLDLSERWGKPMHNHNSHLDGRDVDIPLILNDLQRIGEPTIRTVNSELNWFLLKAFVDTCDVEYVFLDLRVQKQLYEYARQHLVLQTVLPLIFQYQPPDSQQQKAPGQKSIVQHWPAHQDHFHVRFRYEKGPLPRQVVLYCNWLKRKVVP